MVTNRGTSVLRGAEDILFGKRPQNYSGLSAEIVEKDGEFLLFSFDEKGEIPPTAEILCSAGKYLWDQGVRECPVTVKEGISGEERVLVVSTCGDGVTAVTVGMGKGNFDPKNIPIRFEKPLVNDMVSLPDCKPFRLTALSFQAPYGVVFLDTAGDCLVLNRGEEISSMNLFPQGAEIVFAHNRGDAELYLRACHRDGGTYVFGKDICAALLAAVATGRCLPDRGVSIPLPQGTVRAVCTKEGELFLTLPILS